MTQTAPTQTAGPRIARPLSRRALSSRSVRIEPTNAFLGSDQGFRPDPIVQLLIESADPQFSTLPIEPLAAMPTARRTLTRAWLATIIASIALHLAVAAWFMLSPSSDDVLVAGGEEIAAVQLGEADADSAMAGDLSAAEAASVVFVEMIVPTPAEQDAPVAAPPIEMPEPIKPVDLVAPLRLAPPPDFPAIQPAEPPAPEAPPEILATDVPEPVDNVATVTPPPAPVVVDSTAEKRKAVELEARRADERREAEDRRKREAEAERRKAKQAEARQKVAEKKKADAARAKLEAADAAKKAKATARAGNQGKSAANARKGRADGEARGAVSGSKAKGKASAAGNAAVSNYPGKVRARISRAAGRIPRSARAGASGDVVVSFTVTASGGLGGVSIARSSGAAKLDAAAIAAVKRAAPFPKIPNGAGRSSWQFTIPMGLAR